MPDDDELVIRPLDRPGDLGWVVMAHGELYARAAGYRRITLWTNDVLVSARRIYEAAGFQLVASEPHHSFGHDLVGQNWSLEL